MNSISRGIRNAFRNVVRTVSIITILGLSIGLSLIMLIAQKAVDTKIANFKSSVGNTVTITAAGTMGFQGGGDPLQQSAITKLKSNDHITAIDSSISDQLRNTERTNRQGTTEAANTSLVSSIEGGSLGQRFQGNTSTDNSNSGNAPTPPDGNASGGFTPPVSTYGQSDTSKLNGALLRITSGNTIDGSADKDVALIGSTLASKNNLKVGSTFIAYGSTITVAGIYDSGSTFSNNSVLFSLPTLQRLSGQSGEVTGATITVDSVSNIDSVTAAVKKSLGTGADVTNSKETVESAVSQLDSVKSIARVSLIGALTAGAIIILLTMIMIVRERKREIGIVKAIGGSNLRVMGEFMVEALTLAILGAVIGLLLGIIGGQPVTKLLVDNSASSSSSSSNAVPGQGGPGRMNGGNSGPQGGPGGSGFRRSIDNNSTLRSARNVQTQIGWQVIAQGFGAAILIAVIGSGLAAGMISKVRPVNVMRAD